MANPWFRLYSEFADDPKVQMMAEALQRRLIMLFCSRCKGETLHETELAFHWRVTETEVEQTKAVFIEKGFIDEHWNVLNWNRRQYLSDSSTDRVRAHRERKKQDETLQEQYATQSVTPPEQNRIEQKQNKSDISPAIRPEEFANIWNAERGHLPRLTEFTHSRRDKVKTRITQGLTLEKYRAVVIACRSKPFLAGDKGWKATFDWTVANDKNYLKALENDYGAEPKQQERKIIYTTPGGGE